MCRRVSFLPLYAYYSNKMFYSIFLYRLDTLSCFTNYQRTALTFPSSNDRKSGQEFPKRDNASNFQLILGCNYKR